MYRERILALALLILFIASWLGTLYLFWRFNLGQFFFGETFINLLTFPGIIFIPPMTYFSTWLVFDFLQEPKKRKQVKTMWFQKAPLLLFILLYALASISSFFGYNSWFRNLAFQVRMVNITSSIQLETLGYLIFAVAIFPFVAALFFFFTEGSSLGRITRIILTLILFISFCAIFLFTITSPLGFLFIR